MKVNDIENGQTTSDRQQEKSERIGSLKWLIQLIKKYSKTMRIKRKYKSWSSGVKERSLL